MGDTVDLTGLEQATDDACVLIDRLRAEKAEAIDGWEQASRRAHDMSVLHRGHRWTHCLQHSCSLDRAAIACLRGEP